MTFSFHIDIPASLKDRLPQMQANFDSTIVRTCDPYIPFDSGALAHNVTGIGTGMIEWLSPYAHYLYMGEKYDPAFPIFENGILVAFRSKKGITKHPSGKPLKYNTEKHTLAGDHWFERAMANHLDEWKEAING